MAAGVAVQEAVAPREDGNNMHSLARTFFSGEEQRQITETVQRVERLTSGEIVPLAASSSSSYADTVLIAALVLTLPLALIIAFTFSTFFWWQGEVLWLFLLSFSFCFFLARMLVCRWPALFRLFLHSSRAEKEVEQAAFTQFFAQGLHHTRKATGVLIYLSVLERKVWILGDRGINRVVQPERWQQLVDQLTEGIKAGRQAETLCQVVESVGGILQEHFPPQTDDRNELANLLILNDQETPRKPHALIVQ